MADRLRDTVVAGYLGDESSARAALTDPSADIRAAALGALSRAGALTDDDVRAALTDSAASVVARAVELAIARPQVDLLGVTDGRDAAVVEVAAWALGERGAGQPAAVVDRLTELARHHSDPLVREAAVAALGAIGDPRGRDAVLAATRDKPAIRRRAVAALAAFDGDEVDAALQRAKEDRDWQVRQIAEDLLD
ncbi:MAG TPA: HEAT repeat domain-containing protein [Acidimicrobiales bacterium]|nr:HEAT repeat domain-containing protein [Acidimicrobiales bacterium]